MSELNWSGRLETSHERPREARYLGLCSVTGKRRVSVLGDYAAKLPPSSPDANWQTVFLYDPEGRCRGADGSGEDFDLVNPA